MIIKSLVTKTIISDDVDGLVVKGIRYIKEQGRAISTRAGESIQAYNVNYVLLNSRNRVHNLRQPRSIRYLCRELLAYFKGSLNVNDGLAQASSYWDSLADKKGRINSNYGYYVFYQKVRGHTQYEWIISNLRRNNQSRKAMCNINQPFHKFMETKDFPCAVSAQFFVREDNLCCDVISRSADIIWGLPYDIGFFSFLTELVCADLNETNRNRLNLGYTSFRCSFTQIYRQTAHLAEDVLFKNKQNNIQKFRMPVIENARSTLKDIYGGTRNTAIMRWIYENKDM